MTSLDEFFFRRKEGGIEHLAGAAAMALRAAGVPTRLVSGYRGGNLIALTNFIVVRQGNAHVWVEAWQDATGWQRVEALDFVAPPTLENRSRALLVKPQAQKAEQAKTSGEAAAARVDKGAEQPVAQAQARSPKSPVSVQFGWLNNITKGLETWVLNYNPDRQVELLKKTGFKRVNWQTLLALTGDLGDLACACATGCSAPLSTRAAAASPEVLACSAFCA